MRDFHTRGFIKDSVFGLNNQFFPLFPTTDDWPTDDMDTIVEWWHLIVSETRAVLRNIYIRFYL